MVMLKKTDHIGSVDGVNGCSSQQITEEGLYQMVFTCHKTGSKCCVLIPVKVYETPLNIPILGMGKLRQCGFKLTGITQEYEDRLIAPNSFPAGTFTYLFQTKVAGHYRLMQDMTPKPQTPPPSTAITCDGCIFTESRGKQSCCVAGVCQDAEKSIFSEEFSHIGKEIEAHMSRSDSEHPTEGNAYTTQDGAKMSPEQPEPDSRFLNLIPQDRKWLNEAIHEYYVSECKPGYTVVYNFSNGFSTGKIQATMVSNKSATKVGLYSNYADAFGARQDAINSDHHKKSRENCGNMTFKASIEIKVGHSAQQDHCTLNHCGPDKHRRTMTSSTSVLDGMSEINRNKYVEDIETVKCRACDATPNLKPGISHKSGRVKPHKHTSAVAKINIQADAVKQGVKLCFDVAFNEKHDRGDFDMTSWPVTKGEGKEGDLSETQDVDSEDQLVTLLQQSNNLHVPYSKGHGGKGPNDDVLGSTKLKISMAATHPEIYRWLTPVPIQGKVISQEGYERRIDIAAIRIFERLWIDLKSLPKGQFQGRQYALIMVDYKSFCIDVMLMKTKDETADCIAKLVVRRGIHKLPYTVTVHHDNDGSNLAIAVKLSRYGIRTEPTVPYRQSLQLAELAIRMIVKAAKRLCIHAKFHHMWLGLALEHAAHHHNYITGSESRGFKSPNEMLWNTKQDITQLQPFGMMVYVVKTEPKKRNSRFNERNPMEVLTSAVPGFIVGYQSVFFNSTKKILTLDGNIICSLDVYCKDTDPRDPNEINPKVFLQSFDGTSFKEHEDLISVYETLGYANMSDDELERRVKLIPIKGTQYKGFIPEENNLDMILQQFYKGYSRTKARQMMLDFVLEEEGAQDDSLDEGWEESAEGADVPKTSTPTPAGEDTPAEDLPARKTRKGTTFGAAAIQTVKTAISTENPNQTVTTTYGTAETVGSEGPEGRDDNISDQTVPIRYYEVMLASGVMSEQISWANDKDIPWGKALATENIKDKVIEAYEAEYDSLTGKHKVLHKLNPDDEEYDKAVKESCKARAILGIKRCGRVKVRIVLRGDLQDKEKVDPPNFNYYARVVSLTSVRIALGGFNASDECMAFIDISTAFLQTDRYDETVIKYVKLKNPITGETIYFKQLGSLYGETSAPALWERTIATWIQDQGFIRGRNDPCCFYHSQRKLRITLYVDDLKMIGKREQIFWFHELLIKRFETRELIWLNPGITQDYLGMEVSMDDGMNVYVSMQSYSLKLIQFMEMEMIGKECRIVACPFVESLHPCTSLTRVSLNEFKL